MLRILTVSEYYRFAKNHKNIVPDVSEAVRGILDDVRERGDAAVKEYEQKFDGVELDGLEVSPEEISEALEKVDGGYIAMLERAASNIECFHRRQLHEGFMFSPKEGVILGQRVIPLQRVGIYVPGGTASYPSSVLMNALPARVAGCGEVMIATPPEISPKIIAAAKVSGVHRIFKMGGAQAIGAFAFGTESVPRVDKITGPGNAYVAEAKRQVFGRTGIDMVAGPSEIVIVADRNNFAGHLAADMLAQAEHDVNARAVLITNSRRFAQNINAEIEVQAGKLERYDIARASIDNNGMIIVVSNWGQAVDIVNEIAPEHLELCVEEPFEWLTKIRNAGSIFLGRHSPEALGDYYAGANHTLPTMGTARFSSPLSVDDFVKKMQYMYYDGQALREASRDIEEFAMSEGLTGHARSITIRRD